MFKNGTEWLCADFHLHTKSDKEFIFNGEDDTFVNSYIEKLKAKDIQIACIANHNKFDKAQYKALARKGRKNKIIFYPGVELSVKEGSNGIHCIILFNEDEWVRGQNNNSINDFLGEVFKGVLNSENANVKSNTDLMGTIEILKSFRKDFFIVLAHVDDKSGFFYECDGGLISALTNKADFNKYILGFQKSRNGDNLRNYMTNWGGNEIALVEGSDCKSIEDIGKNEKKVYVKLGDRSFYTLKYALQDFRNRISFEKPVNNHGYISSIKYVGGKMDGVEINFSSNLNSLIGIRGSGKSSILETVRYALSLIPNIDDDYKKKLVNNVLGSGGEIIIEAFDKDGRKYELRKILNENTAILDENGNDLSITVNSIINNALYFGQKDLSSTQTGYEFMLLEKLVGDKIDTDLGQLTRYNNDLKNNIRELVQIKEESQSIEELRAKNNDLNHKMKIYTEKGLDKKLEKQTAYNKDQIKLNQFISKVNDVSETLSTALNSIEVQDLEIGSYQSSHNYEIFCKVDHELTLVRKLISDIQNSILSITEKSSNLDALSIELETEINSLKQEFAEIKREIQEESLNPDTYLEYSSRFEENKQKIKALEIKEQKTADLIIGIKSAERERNNALKGIFNQYTSYIESINNAQDELKLSIEFKGDKRNFKKSMIENFRGTGLSELKISKISEKFSDYVAILVDFFSNKGEKLKEIMTENEYVKLSAKILENYDAYIDIETANLVQIYYHDKPLENHSLGQRASALILFILTQQDNDLIIIDQPEDDLDNQVIYKEVIRTIKNKKQDMQFIFATHNANIPVLGDSEVVLSTEYDNEKITVCAGNIDSPLTQKNIVDIMEGGQEAFEKRKMIYNTWDNKITSNFNV